MNWDKTSIDLGEVRQNKRQIIEFKAIKKLDIVELGSSCGCSKPVFDKDNGILMVYYTPGEIPYHRRKEGFYSTEKSIDVRYKDDTQEKLSFSAKVVN